MNNLKGKIEGLLLDFGGTIDTDGRHWANVLYDAYAEAEVGVSVEQFREAYVKGERHLAAHPCIETGDNFRTMLRKKLTLELSFLNEAGAIAQTNCGINELAETLSRICDERVRTTLATARPLLSRLARRIPMVLVTNFYGNMRSVLQAYELDMFSAVVESAVVGVRKPDPAIWELGRRELGTPACRTLACGDSFEKDVLPARSLGMRTVWLKGEEWKPKPHDECLPDAVIAHLCELEALL